MVHILGNRAENRCKTPGVAGRVFALGIDVLGSGSGLATKYFNTVYDA